MGQKSKSRLTKINQPSAFSSPESFAGSTESLSTQSGSYHLPSSAYTPNEASFKFEEEGADNFGTLEAVKSMVRDEPDDITQKRGQQLTSRPFDPGGDSDRISTERQVRPKTPFNTANKY